LAAGGGGSPDLRGMFIAGAGGDYDVGDTGGSDTVNISHTHSNGSYAAASAGSHTHGPGTLQTGEPSLTSTILQGSGGMTTLAHHMHIHDLDYGVTASGGSHSHDVSGTSSSGGSAAVENRPAFYALAFIMKM
jgi:hypothetical protein